jgi:hypothetical protein
VVAWCSRQQLMPICAASTAAAVLSSDPTTHEWEGKVVIAAGGHSGAWTSIGESVGAFRLAIEGETSHH